MTQPLGDSHRFKTSDGVSLHFIEQGRGPPVILLPGWTQPACGFAGQLAGLSSSFRCFALDPRGHGESERPNHGYRVSRLARDLLDFLDYLELDEAILLGHSAGCTVVWSFIDLFGENRIKALVFCDEMITMIRRPEWSNEECARYGALLDGDEALKLASRIAGPDGEQELTEFLSRSFGANFPQDRLDVVIRNSLKMPREHAAQLLSSVMPADYRDILSRIHSPTLCIGGTRSHLGATVMPWIASCIACAKVVMIDAKHFVHLEQPEAFNAAVREFLERVVPG